MGKASRRKHRQQLQKATLKKYGQVKLSDAIAYLAEPFNKDELGFDGYQSLVTMAVAAWNIALSDDVEGRDQKFSEAMASLPSIGEQFAWGVAVLTGIPICQEPSGNYVKRQLLAELVKRKDAFYPNDDRYIVGFELEPATKGYHLQIRSLIPKRLDA